MAFQSAVVYNMDFRPAYLLVVSCLTARAQLGHDHNAVSSADLTAAWLKEALMPAAHTPHAAGSRVVQRWRKQPSSPTTGPTTAKNSSGSHGGRDSESSEAMHFPWEADEAPLAARLAELERLRAASPDDYEPWPSGTADYDAAVSAWEEM